MRFVTVSYGGWDHHAGIENAMRRQAGRDGRHSVYWLSLSGLACLIAFLCAGLFEYNYGDSEVLILLLFMLTAPYVANRKQDNPV